MPEQTEQTEHEFDVVMSHIVKVKSWKFEHDPSNEYELLCNAAEAAVGYALAGDEPDKLFLVEGRLFQGQDPTQWWDDAEHSSGDKVLGWVEYDLEYVGTEVDER